MLRTVLLLAGCVVVTFAQSGKGWGFNKPGWKPSGGGGSGGSGGSGSGKSCSCGDVPSGNRLIKQWVPDAKIVGGQMCAQAAAPWQCALVQYREGYFPAEFCGASIVGCRHILTASHCIDNLVSAEDVKGIRVICGENNLVKAFKNATNKMYKVLKVHKHPQYNVPDDSTNNDVAILHLDRQIKYDSSTQRVCLAKTPVTDKSKHKFYDKSSIVDRPVAIVTGYGNQYEGQQKDYNDPNAPTIGAGSDDLFQVTVPLWTADECYKTYANYQYDVQKMICGGYDNQEKDSCQGDSGGPLVIERPDGCYEQIGVVSWGLGCARPGVPGIYANVYNLMDFIRSSIAESGTACSNEDI